MADTRVDLVSDLLKKKASPKRRELVEMASRGDFHDFKSKKFPVPKLALAQMLAQAGYSDLFDKTVDGHYDETPTAEDCKKLKEKDPHMYNLLFTEDGKRRYT